MAAAAAGALGERQSDLAWLRPRYIPPDLSPSRSAVAGGNRDDERPRATTPLFVFEGSFGGFRPQQLPDAQGIRNELAGNRTLFPAHAFVLMRHNDKYFLVQLRCY